MRKAVGDNIPLFTSLLLLLVCLLLCFLSVYQPIGDYINYYYGSWFLKENRFGSFIYSPHEFNLEVRKLHSGYFFGNYTPVPPLTAIIFLPLSYISVFTSKLIFNLISSVLFVFIFFRFLKFLKADSFYFLLVPIILFIPLKSNLYQGQLYLLTLGLLIAGYIFSEKSRSILAAVCFGLAIALKIHPAIILLYFLANKQFRILSLTLVFSVIFSLVPALVIDTQIISNYFLEIFPRLMRGEINSPYATTYQSLTVLLRKIWVYDSLLNPNSILLRHNIFLALNLLFVFGGAIYFYLILKAEKNSLKGFSVCLFAGILLSGYGSVYGLLFLLPFAVSVISERKSVGFYLVLLALTCYIPVTLFFEMPLLLQFPRLILLMTICMVIFYSYKKMYLQGAIFFLLLLVIVYAVVPKENPQNFTTVNILTSKKDILVYDYAILEDSLLLSYISPYGASTDKIHFPETLYANSSIRIQHNELFVNNRQTTFDGARKRKPAFLVNENAVLCLSDKGRGVGFYTLVKFPL